MLISFEVAMHDADVFVVSPGCKTENRGYFTNYRVDRATLPSGWYAYDIRHGDSGNFCALEPFVRVNHGGTFLTQKPIKMNSRGYHSLCKGAGYTFE